MTVRKVALRTAGGLAPCLSSAVAELVAAWNRRDPFVEIIGYRDGYAGLLTGKSVNLDPLRRDDAQAQLHALGGSPLGNSRVKLTNAADCARRGLVPEGADPLAVAAAQLERDGIDVIHTIGGDDTSTTAAELARHLAETGLDLTVVGLPKTVDNDVIPVRLTLGASTAATVGATLARNVVAEHSANPRMLVVHEIMGRHCGWLAAATAQHYQAWANSIALGGVVEAGRWGIHALWLPEAPVAIDAEIERLGPLMDRHGSVNVFVAEGAGAGEIAAAAEAAGAELARDAFGHVRLDTLNCGSHWAKALATGLGAEKTLVVKSGYFARSAPAGTIDRDLIAASAVTATSAALDRVSGLIGQDEDHRDELRPIELDRVAGGRAFDTSTGWYQDLQDQIHNQ